MFFTLFGAVALVGVIGAATATLMRGPVGTMVNLNQKAKVDSQEQIAGKLAMLEAANQPNSGDCDNDGYVEPLPPDLTCASHPAGGGCIPSAIGSAKNDPWGTAYGYCAWDLGASQCGTPGLLQGANAQDKTVIAIISAGPDRTFQTTCGADPAYVHTPSGSDDVVLSYTYAEAVQASGGLWILKSGAPGTATIDKNIDVSGTASFQSGITGNTDFSGGNFNFAGASGFFLPNQTNSGACAGSDTGGLRTDNSTSTQLLQICDPAAPVGPHNHAGWVDVGGTDAGTGVAGADTDVQYNAAGVFGASANFTWNNAANTLNVANVAVGTNATVGGTLGVTGNATVGGTLGVTGSTTVGGTLGVTGKLTTTTDTAVGGNLGVTGNSEVGGNTLADGTLGVTGLSTLGGGALVSQGSAGAPGLGFLGASSTGLFYTSGGVGMSVAGAGIATVSTAGLSVAGNIGSSGYMIASGEMVGSDFALGTVGSGLGIYSDGAGGLALRTASLSRMDIASNGNIGVMVTGAPTTTLDLGGVMRLRPIGDVPGSTCPGIAGAITYASGDQLLVCSSETGNWETIGTSGGGGGGVGNYWTKLPSGQLYYNSASVGVGTANPLGAFEVAGGDLTVLGSYTGTAAPAFSGAGTRMFFDPASGAFREGTVTGSAWDSGNVGNYSVGLGQDAEASGADSFSLGSATLASVANSYAFGQTAIASGPGSVVFGLSLNGATYPTVSGTSSYGIFMGNQTGVYLSQSDAFGLFGGRMIIDPNAPSTMLATNGSLSLDINGNAGATQYCDQLGNNCFTAADIAQGITGAPGLNREIIYNSGGDLGADAGLSYSSTGFVVAAKGIVIGGSGADTNGTFVNGGNSTSTGADNTYIGVSAGAANTTGTNNTFLGFYAGSATTTGSNNIVIGSNIGTSGTSIGNYLNIGNSIYGDMSSGLIYISGTGALKLPVGDNSNKPAGVNGMIRYNTANGKFEAFQQGAWQDILTGAATMNAAGSDQQVQFNNNGALGAASGFSFNSSTGLLTATAMTVTNTASGGTGLTGADNTGAGIGVYGSTSSTTTAAAGVVGIASGASGATYGVYASNNSAAGWSLYAAGTSPSYLQGNVGIGQTAPAAALDVNGEIRTTGNTLACSAATTGSIRYDSATKAFDYCGGATPAWTAFSGAGASAAGSDQQIQLNNNGVLYASTGLTFSSSTGLLTVAGSGAAAGLSASDSNTGTAAGLKGTENGASNTGYGVYAVNAGGGAVANYGVYGTTNATGAGAGLYGSITGASNTGYGIQAVNNSAAGWGVYASGSSPEYFAGNVGIGQLAPVTKLDVNGTIRIAYSGEACDASHLGAIYYNSATGLFMGCKTAGSWANIASGGVTLPAGSDQQVQFNNNGALGAASGFSFNSSTGLLTATAMTVTNTASGGTGLTGADNTGAGIGVYGSTSSTTTAAAGVVGIASGASGATYGVYASNNSAAGWSLYAAGTSPSYLQGNVGIGQTAPAAALDVNGEIRTTGNTLACSAATTGSIRYDSATKAFDYCGGATPAWTAFSGGATPTLSSLTAATTSNTIDNVSYAQNWQWNSLAGGNGLNLSSTSTAATSNTQSLLNLSLSGTNATSTQTTYAAYIANTHAGTASTNYGVYATTSGGLTANYSLYGTTSSTVAGSTGVYGAATGSAATYGVYGSDASATGYAGYFTNSNTSGVGIYTTGPVQIASTSNMTLCTTTTAGSIRYNSSSKAFDYCGGATPAWTAFSSGGSVSFSSMTGALGVNTIDNAAYGQTWTWNTLTAGAGLSITTSSMTTGTLLNLSNTNSANNAGTTLYVSNNSVNGYGIQGVANSAGAVAIQGAASNATGVAIYGFNTGSGGQGIIGEADTGAGIGIKGVSSSTVTGTGVFGQEAGTNNTGYAVLALNSSALGWGFYSSGTSPNYFGGNVGVGTTAPKASLDVVGEIRTTGNTLACSSTTTGAIRYNSSTTAFDYCGGATPAWTAFSGAGASAAGSDQQIQLNNNGVLYASTGLTFSSSTGLLTVAGSGAAAGLSASDSNTGTAAGLKGTENGASNTGYGVYAVNAGGGAVANYGVYGTTNATGAGAGLYGSITGASNTGYGIQAVNNSAAGWGVYASGSSPEYFAGNVGIGQLAPVTKLDVNGTIRIAYSGEACDASHLGAIYYNSATGLFMGCKTAGSWANIASGGVTLPAGSDQQVQFNNNGALGAASGFSFNSSTGLLTATAMTVTNTASGGTGLTGADNTGAGIGVYGSTSSTTTAAAGVVGIASGASGATYGVYASNNSAAGWSLYAAGTSPSYLQGNVGIGQTAPAAALDVNGEIRTTGNTLACSAATTGSIRYDSATKAFDYCGGATPAWTAFSGAGASAAGSDQQIQLNNNGVLYASTGLTFSSSTGLLTVAGSGAAAGLSASDSNTGTAAGLKGTENGASNTGYGVYAVNAGGGAVANYGVYGTTNATGAGAGLYGSITGASNTGYGIQAVNNSAAGWGVYASGSSPEYFAGNVGIGQLAPVTKLDVNGTIRIAYSGEACDASHLGAIYYNSATGLFMGCKTAGSWANIASGGVTLPAGSDQQVQFNNNGALGAASGFSFNSSTGLLTATAMTVTNTASGGTGLTGADNTGAGIGVYGSTSSTTTAAAGVVGIASGASGATYGVYASNNSAAGWSLYAAGTSPSYLQGNVGIGQTAPAAALDVNGEIRTTGNTLACSAATTGSIRYDSATKAFDYCGGATPAWTAFSGAGASAAGSDQQIQLNNNGVLYASTGLTFSSSTGLLTVAGSGAAAGLSASDSNTGTAAGLKGTENGASNTGYGVYAVNAGGGAVANYGVYGTTNATGAGAGLYGSITGASNTGYGIQAVNNSAAGWGVYASGSSPEYFAGNVGIGQLAPVTKLDVNGTIRIAYSGEACDASHLGAIYYNSATGLFMGCKTAGSWANIASGGVTLPAGSDQQVQFNNNGALGAASGFSFNSSTGLLTATAMTVTNTASGGTGLTGADNTGAGIGVYGSTSSTTTAAAGVVGIASGASGATYGVYASNNSAAGWSLYAAGTSPSYLQGNVGIGQTAPAAALDVNGEIRTTGNTLACSAATTGSIRYDSATKAFDYCGGATPAWTAFSGAGASAAGSDQQIQLNNNGVLYASTGLTFSSSTGLLTVAGSGAAAGLSASDSNTGTAAGLKGTENGASNTGYGVYAVNAGGGAVANYGVYGTTNATGAGAGLYGSITGASNTGYGIQAVNNSAAGWGVYASGSSPEYFAGNVGIGQLAPVTKLDVNGTIRIAYSGEACDASHLGAIYYNSATGLFMGCKTAGSWANIASGGVTLPAGSDQQVQFNNNGALGAASGFSFNSSTGLLTATAMTVTNTASGGTGLTGADNTGAGIGVYGSTSSTTTAAAGVVGIASGASGATYGVYASNNSAAGWSLYAAGTSPSYLQGNVGIGQTAPAAALDVNGEIRTTGNTLACSAATTGSIRYDSATKAFDYCGGATPAWTAFSGAGASAAGSDQQIQLNNNGVLYASTGLTFSSSTGLLTVAGSGAAAGLSASDSNTGTAAGLKGTENGASNTGYGVYAVNAGGGAVANYGVYGTTNATGAGAGLYGSITGASNTGYGIQAVNNSAAGWGVYASGSSPEYFAGNVGIGQLAPVTKLDVNGTIRIAYSGEACDASHLGAIYYNSATGLFMGCKTAGSWANIASGGVTLPAGSDQQVQFNNNGALGAASGFSFNSSTGLLTATAMTVTNTASGGTGLTGADNTGAGIGVYGSTSSTTTAAAGVVGIASGASGATYGVYASNNSAAGWSLYAAGTSPSYLQGNVGIGQTAPAAALDVNGEIRTTGNTLACSAATTGSIRYDSATKAFDYCGGATPAWTAFSGGATPTLSSLTAATTSNTIDNVSYAQNWQWNSLAGGNGLNLSSTSTAATSNTQSLLNLSLSGTNATSTQTTYAAYIANTHAGTASTNYGVYATTSGGLTANYSLYGTTSSTVAGSTGVYGAATGSAATYGVYGTSSSSTGYGGYFANTSTGTALYVAGNIQYTGTLTDTSDRRLKEHIKPLSERGSMLDKFGLLDTYSYDMKSDPDHHTQFGVMAQQMKNVFPELVRTDRTPNRYMSVNYIGLIAPLIQADKELKNENDTLKAQLLALKAQQAEMQSIMSEMRKAITALRTKRVRTLGHHKSASAR